MISIRRVVLACVAVAAPVGAQSAERVSAVDSAALEARMATFIMAAKREQAEELAAFFPRAGDLTYVRTLHRDEGTGVSVWRFPPGDIPRALAPRGPLSASFYIHVDGQPIGLFLHQLITRQGRHRGWRRVGTRFVPLDEPATAGLFVEWRREAGGWVIAAFGDESYNLHDDRKLPEWCC
jgi:hypothetical protein